MSVIPLLLKFSFNYDFLDFIMVGTYSKRLR